MTQTRGTVLNFAVFIWLVTAVTGPTLAHDPVFSPGPHVLFKDGVELHLGTEKTKTGRESANVVRAQFKYGITADWVAGVSAPYIRTEDRQATDNGRGATNLSSKYRFWRNDMQGAQESTAVLGKVIFNDASLDQAKREGNDYLLGLAYGYEGRKWYRWASVRRRFNSDAANGADRGDVWYADLVGGIRFKPTEYTEPDWVWILELNGEIAQTVTNRLAGATSRIGGNQWFLSPGLMWTYRNVAIKTGVQIPVYDDLSQDQASDDYRAVFEFELHL